MLEITIPESEFFNEETNEFIQIPEKKLVLEHSLVSVSKWESKYHKPFLVNDKTQRHSREELLYYIKCMSKDSFDDDVFLCMTSRQIDEISNYIADPMTATTITDHKKHSGGRSQIVTSELIYYWMSTFNIPMECENWHLNRLLTLIKVHIAKSSNDKMSRRDLNKYNSQLNAARKLSLGTRG